MRRFSFGPQSIDSIQIPLIGDIAPWQLAFILVGFPGIFLAIFVYFLKEPPRKVDPNLENKEKPTIVEALKYFYSKAGAMCSFILPACVMTVIAYSQGMACSYV